MPEKDRTPENLIRAIEEKLGSFVEHLSGLTLRERVLRLVEILQQHRALAKSVLREAGCDASGACDRLRWYFVEHVGVVLTADELLVVSGISEYGRRIRELRVEHGYRILTGASNDPEAGLQLKPTEYVLLRAEPDRDAAHRWHVANRIRRLGDVGAKERILRYLIENVGHIVTSEELAYVAKNAREFGRRTRELRTEEGYPVATCFTGRPDLKPGEYVLESADRVAPQHDRHIPTEVAEAVFRRDDNTCRVCRWNHQKWTRDDPRFLELHHFEEHAERGPNTEQNLLVLCNVCHDDVHAGRVQPPKPQ